MYSEQIKKRKNPEKGGAHHNPFGNGNYAPFNKDKISSNCVRAPADLSKPKKASEAASCGAENRCESDSMPYAVVGFQLMKGAYDLSKPTITKPIVDACAKWLEKRLQESYSITNLTVSPFGPTLLELPVLDNTIELITYVKRPGVKDKDYLYRAFQMPTLGDANAKLSSILQERGGSSHFKKDHLVIRFPTALLSSLDFSLPDNEAVPGRSEPSDEEFQDQIEATNAATILKVRLFVVSSESTVADTAKSYFYINEEYIKKYPILRDLFIGLHCWANEQGILSDISIAERNVFERNCFSGSVPGSLYDDIANRVLSLLNLMNIAIIAVTDKEYLTFDYENPEHQKLLEVLKQCQKYRPNEVLDNEIIGRFLCGFFRALSKEIHINKDTHTLYIESVTFEDKRKDTVERSWLNENADKTVFKGTPYLASLTRNYLIDIAEESLRKLVLPFQREDTISNYGYSGLDDWVNAVLFGEGRRDKTHDDPLNTVKSAQRCDKCGIKGTRRCQMCSREGTILCNEDNKDGYCPSCGTIRKYLKGKPLDVLCAQCTLCK